MFNEKIISLTFILVSLFFTQTFASEHASTNERITNKKQAKAYVKLSYEHIRNCDYKKAVESINKAAELNSVEALLFLLNSYTYGELTFGIQKNPKKAEEIFKKFKELASKDAYARLSLGLCYEHGRFVKEDIQEANKCYKEGIQKLRKEAENGDADDKYVLATCYLSGDFVEEDKAEGLKWLNKSATQGGDRAQYLLGQCYANGEIAKDYVKAVQWYRKSAEQGNPEAQEALGDCYANAKGVEKNMSEAIKWWTKAANGSDSARSSIYELMENGSREAFNALYSLAEQGNIYAQTDIADCYADGKFVAQNKEEAFNWWIKSLTQGNYGAIISMSKKAPEYLQKVIELLSKKSDDNRAQFSLGFCYHNGLGVEKNEALAVEWFEKSAQQGNLAAQHTICAIAKEGSKEALEWVRKRAANGDFYAESIMEEIKSAKK